MNFKNVFKILTAKKVLGPDNKWHVYDSDGNELSNPVSGIIWRAIPGALLTWPNGLGAIYEKYVSTIYKTKEINVIYRSIDKNVVNMVKSSTNIKM